MVFSTTGVAEGGGLADYEGETQLKCAAAWRNVGWRLCELHFNKTKDTIGRWAVIVILLGFCLQQQVWAVAKVFLKNGETREGAVLARDGRITIKAVDRLFQHPESAVHRIDHVSGETTLVNTDGVLLKEKPERLSKNLIAIPKGCEVRVTGKEADWTRVEVYGGKSLAEGYIHDDDLADSVFLLSRQPYGSFRGSPSRI